MRRTLLLRAPLVDKYIKNGQVKFEKGTSYTNVFKHLLSCVSDGDEEHFYRTYETAIAQK